MLAADDMPNLILYRDSGWADAWRKYSVWLDNREVARIAGGEKIVFPVSVGDHTLQARIDWCRTKTIQFSVGNTDATFLVRSGLRGWRMMFVWFFLFMPRKWLSLEQRT